MIQKSRVGGFFFEKFPKLTSSKKVGDTFNNIKPVGINIVLPGVVCFQNRVMYVSKKVGDTFNKIESVGINIVLPGSYF